LKASHTHSVSIIGYGWLGKALYTELNSKGVAVEAYSRSIDPRPHLSRFELGRDEMNYNELGQTIVFTMPPKAVINCYGAFKNFVEAVPPEKHFIYISSTSVFGAQQGLCTEKVTPLPDSDRGKRQKELEDFVTSSNEMATVVRAGGLIGDDRFPSFPSNYTFPETDMVNLIDKEDIVSILAKIIEDRIKPSLVHAVAPFHPLKKDYYMQTSTLTAQKSAHKSGKMIFSDYLTKINYTFKNPSLKHPKAAKGKSK